MEYEGNRMFDEYMDRTMLLLTHYPDFITRLKVSHRPLGRDLPTVNVDNLPGDVAAAIM